MPKFVLMKNSPDTVHLHDRGMVCKKDGSAEDQMFFCGTFVLCPKCLGQEFPGVKDGDTIDVTNKRYKYWKSLRKRR